jgi:hypothetical protein
MSSPARFLKGVFGCTITNFGVRKLDLSRGKHNRKNS